LLIPAWLLDLKRACELAGRSFKFTTLARGFSNARRRREAAISAEIFPNIAFVLA
jgi:hypothetical protein